MTSSRTPIGVWDRSGRYHNGPTWDRYKFACYSPIILPVYLYLMRFTVSVKYGGWKDKRPWIPDLTEGLVNVVFGSRFISNSVIGPIVYIPCRLSVVLLLYSCWPNFQGHSMVDHFQEFLVPVLHLYVI